MYMYMYIKMFGKREISTWNFGEELGRFVHRFVGFVDVLLDAFRVDAGEGVVHPRLVPAQPVRRRQPQVLERLELFRQTTQLVVLQEAKIKA